MKKRVFTYAALLIGIAFVMVEYRDVARRSIAYDQRDRLEQEMVRKELTIHRLTVEADSLYAAATAAKDGVTVAVAKSDVAVAAFDSSARELRIEPLPLGTAPTEIVLVNDRPYPVDTTVARAFLRVLENAARAIAAKDAALQESLAMGKLSYDAATTYKTALETAQSSRAMLVELHEIELEHEEGHTRTWRRRAIGAGLVALAITVVAVR